MTCVLYAPSLLALASTIQERYKYPHLTSNKAKLKESKFLAQVMKKKEIKISNKQTAGARFGARKHIQIVYFTPKF